MFLRAIVWLQNRREATMERSRPSTTVRRDDPGEFRVGRLKHERVKVPRGEAMMEWAESVMQLHADRKSVLEVEFQGEEGTGLGPTLEFYALIAAEFQRTSLGIWLCDDDFPDDESRQVRRSEPRPRRLPVLSETSDLGSEICPASVSRWTWAGV